MKRKTIAQLEQAIKELRELLIMDACTIKMWQDKTATAEKRIQQIAAENESLRMDAKWLRQLCQNLTETVRAIGQSR